MPSHDAPENYASGDRIGFVRIFEISCFPEMRIGATYWVTNIDRQPNVQITKQMTKIKKFQKKLNYLLLLLQEKKKRVKNTICSK